MKYYKNLSLIHQLYVLFLVTVVAIVGALAILYGVSFDIIREKESKYMYNTVSHIAQKTQDVSNSVDLITSTVANSSAAKHFLVEDNLLRKWEYRQSINNLIAEMARSDPNISNMLLLDNDGAVYAFSGFDYSIANKLNTKYKLLTSGEYSNGFSGVVSLSDQEKYFVCIQPVIYTELSTGEKLTVGRCLVACNTELLTKACRDTITADTSYLMILDANNQVLASNVYLDESIERAMSRLNQNGKESLYSGKINGGKYLMCEYPPLELTGWKVLAAIPYRDIYSGLYTFQTLAIIFVIVLLLGFYVLTRQTITNITKPLMKILDFVQKGPYHTLHNHIEMTGHNEIDALGNSINLMLDEINGLNETVLQKQSRLYEVELANNQAKLLALQSQINPHFLYNTLESIQGLTYLGECDKIRTVISSLAFILRYSIAGESMVTVEKEIQCVEKYLQIIERRFPERFDMRICVDERIHQYMMPRFLLQPLVENAVFHGLERRKEGGTLLFTGELRENGVIHFACVDNGKGFSQERLEQINRMLDDASNNSDNSVKKYSDGIGLKNIHMRLRLIYGKPYGLSINSKPMVETSVCVEFPAQQTQDANAGNAE